MPSELCTASETRENLCTAKWIMSGNSKTRRIQSLKEIRDKNLIPTKSLVTIDIFTIVYTSTHVSWKVFKLIIISSSSIYVYSRLYIYF